MTIHRLIQLVATCIVCMSVLAFAFGLMTAPAPAQEVLPEQSALVTACNIATAQAMSQGVAFKWCRKVSVLEEGNTALVAVRVNVPGQGIFVVSVYLLKSAWSQAAFSVVPE